VNNQRVDQHALQQHGGLQLSALCHRAIFGSISGEHANTALEMRGRHKHATPAVSASQAGEDSPSWWFNNRARRGSLVAP
jgi:hypothetical protein